MAIELVHYQMNFKEHDFQTVFTQQWLELMDIQPSGAVMSTCAPLQYKTRPNCKLQIAVTTLKAIIYHRGDLPHRIMSDAFVAIYDSL